MFLKYFVVIVIKQRNDNIEKRGVLKYIILFIVTIYTTMVTFSLFDLKDELKQSISVHQTIEKNRLDSVTYMLQRLSRTVFTLTVTPEVVDLIRKGKRDALYTHIKSLKCEYLKKIHFVLADGTSFLRVHKPHKYGDSLLKRRPIYADLLKQKKELHGFEVGTTESAYRNVFPIFFEGELIAFVDVAFNSTEFLRFVSENEFFLFALKESIVPEKKIYTPFFLEPTLWVKKRDLTDKTPLLDLQSFKKMDSFFMPCGRIFSHNKHYYISAFVPLTDTKKETFGYFVYIDKSKEVNHLFSDFYNNITHYTLFLIFSFLFLFSYKHLKRIEAESQTDKLTRILNRRGLSKKLQKLSYYGVVIIDIDHFKRINDSYGHDVGDRTLQKLTQTLSKEIRNNDIFARWGGEEFIIIYPHLDHKFLNRVTEKLRITVASEYFDEANHITVSIGATIKKEQESFEDAVKRSDKALYQAKQEGRNRTRIKP